MHYQAINRGVLLILSVLSILNNNIVKSDSTPSRLNLFSDAFVQAVQNSPQLLEVFDISLPSFEISRITFEEDWVALEKLGVPFPNSSAKAVADALFVTANYMTPESYIKAYAGSVALYLLSQNLLTPDNAYSQAARLADTILKSYPGDGVAANVVSNSTLIRAICNGISDYLTESGECIPLTKPFQSMSLVKHFYSVTVIGEPEEAVSIITNPEVIPPAVDVYGIAAFSSAFSAAVSSSAVLQGILKVDQPSDDVSQAWSDAANAYCASVNCYNRAGSNLRLHNAVLMTYKYLPRSRFVNAVSNAYAMSMIGLGTLSVDNADSSAKTLTALLETLLSALPSDAGLAVRLVVVFKVLESLVPPSNNIAIQYSVFNHNLVLELFAAAPISSPNFT